MPIKVKICGIKDAETAKFAEDNGADFLGFVFFKRSPRNISTKEFSEIKKSLSGKAKTVAVVVKPDDQLLEEIKKISPDYIQLHGNENFVQVSDIAINTGIKIIKAIPVFDEDDVRSATKYLEADKYAVEYILFDAKPPKNSELPGGNAVSFDWNLLKDFSANYNWDILPAVLPHLFRKPNWILSGGLTPDNVKEAITTTKADFVDVSSGVESAPGVKDKNKILEFIQNAKS